MTAMRDIARYIADAADHTLTLPTRFPDTPFYIAFLDDDSDYMPAALDMMRDLMHALTDDNPDDACTELIARIERDDTMLTDDHTHYSELPLDAPCDLPIRDAFAD